MNPDLDDDRTQTTRFLEAVERIADSLEAVEQLAALVRSHVREPEPVRPPVRVAPARIEGDRVIFRLEAR